VELQAFALELDRCDRKIGPKVLGLVTQMNPYLRKRRRAKAGRMRVIETVGVALSMALILYSPKSKNVEAIIGQSCWHISTVRCAVWR
jgi:hypothetical protein